MTLFKKIILLSFVFSLNLSAQVLPGDGGYLILKNGDYDFIFQEQNKNEIPKLLRAHEKIKSLYEKSFSWKLDEKATLTLASDKNQIANAYATVLPNVQNVFYNGGGSVYDYFTAKSWLLTLLSHEGAHLYQLDAKQGGSEIYHRLFGNASLHLFSIIPIFGFPNALLPNFLLEGNSVLNESRIGNGGRLYSPEERALFYALLKNSLLDSTRLLNNHLAFPYGREKYTVGAYFMLYLAERFGTDKVNQLFLRHAEHEINPFRVNQTFVDHFGVGFYDLVNDFISSYAPKALGQKELLDLPIKEASFISPLNSDEESIYFLTSDGKSPKVLNVYHKKERRLESFSKDLPLGKVFKLSSREYVSSSSARFSLGEIKFSLWNENYKDAPEFRGKIVLDKKGDHTLWLDPVSSFDEPKLYLDNEFYDTIHSGALFGEDGHIYYFKQQGNERTLFSDKKELIKFPSYYAKLVDVDQNSVVYFIGSTEFGSSLFSYHEGKISRLSSSDTIIDAKKIDNDLFLAAEVSGNGYRVKTFAPSASETSPILYSYYFEKEPAFKLSEEIATATETVEFKTRDYSLFKDMRFSGVQTSLGLGLEKPYINALARFTDPLGYHNLHFSLLHDSYNERKIYSSIYINKRYPVYLFLGFLHVEETRFRLWTEKYLKKEEITKVGAIWPFYKTALFTFSLESFVSHLSERETFTNTSALDFLYARDYPLNFYPYRYYKLRLEHDRGQDKFETSDAVLNFYHGFSYEIFLHIFSLLKQTNEDELKLSESFGGENGILSENYSLFGRDFDLKKGGRFSVEFSQAYKTGLYFSKFPLSLRQVAPKFIYNYYFYKKNQYEDFQERGIGLEGDLLLLNLFPFRLNVAALKKEKDDAYVLIRLGSEMTF